MNFQGTRVSGVEQALIGMRLPMSRNYEDAWNKSDSFDENGFFIGIGEDDMRIAKNLIKADEKKCGGGTPNSKFLQMIEIWVSIEAPLAFWKEMDTYRHMVKNSTSTMHKIHSSEITYECFEPKPNGEYSSLIDIQKLEETRKIYNETKDKNVWYDLIYGLNDSWLQTRMCHFNYQTLRDIVLWRAAHKQNCWSGKDNPEMKNFISWAKELPYAIELCFELEEKKYSIVSGGFDPLHKGHIELIKDAAKISKDGVIVIMNSDEWLRERKHRPLLQRESREAVLRSIKGVVDVIYDDFDVDGTVKVALSKIREKYPMAQLSFCNGGDRSEYKDVPESCLCESLDIDLCFGVGGREKIESSSSILEKYKKGE